ncbi:hypothetical protein PTKIN_Ptkin13bG0101600 [Pterospermum kingtungense]
MNGKIKVQDEDVDRLCFWDLMATAKKLGYNLDNYSVNIYYLKVGQTLVKGLKLIANDGDVLELADEMRRNMIVDIYFELVMGKRNMKFPEALVDHSEKDPINGQGDRVSAENLEHVSGQGERVAAENLEAINAQGERVAGKNLELVDGQDVIVENFEDEGNSDFENELERDSDEAFEEDLVDVQWDNAQDFDIDEELIEARQKVKEYVKRKRTLCLAAHIVDDSAPLPLIRLMWILTRCRDMTVITCQNLTPAVLYRMKKNLKKMMDKELNQALETTIRKMFSQISMLD